MMQIVSEKGSPTCLLIVYVKTITALRADSIARSIYNAGRRILTDDIPIARDGRVHGATEGAGEVTCRSGLPIIHIDFPFAAG